MSSSGSPSSPGPRSRPTLRLFTPDELAAADADAPRGLSPCMSLAAFYLAFIAPHWLKERRASTKTTAEYTRSIELWAQLTGDPPLRAITDETTAAFIGGLFDSPGRAAEKMSAWTVRKHVRNIRTCLRLAGPKTDRCRKAQRLLEDVPWIETPPAEDSDGVHDNFTIAEIDAIIKACRLMLRPRHALTGIAPGRWWLSLVAVVYNTGERKGAIFQVEQPPPGAAEIRFPAGIRKGKRRTKLVALNPYAREAIEAIRTDRKLLFPWPHCPRHFYTVWHKLLERANIPPERWFGLHGLRKATATEISAYSPMGAQLVMGHSDGTLLQKHYVNRRIEADALARLPQPDWNAGSQLRLF